MCSDSASPWTTRSRAPHCGAGATQRLNDRLMRARFEQHGAGHLGVTAEHGLVVPLVFRNRQYGVLVALDHLEHGEFHR